MLLDLPQSTYVGWIGVTLSSFVNVHKKDLMKQLYDYKVTRLVNRCAG
jgi:hypothetical protein